MEASARSPSELNAESVQLEHGVELRCAMHARDGSVELGLAHHDRHLAAAVFHPAAPDRTFRVKTHLLDAELEVHVDHFTGEVSASGHFAVLEHSLIRLNKRVLARFSPCSGSVGQSTGSPARQRRDVRRISALRLTHHTDLRRRGAPSADAGRGDSQAAQIS
jgi:hypothetical protein